ncbi:hypothetical protein GCM10008179_10430 [Hansschlegelia plantiphila]|uniref:Uncharacterized protein n=2 Tax=Hansschlegelia plantiphila TaxID=374655 RepID=A0A9W6MV63_9HYPH|nr:hypothetical protein GCM10008179_10430 [Hansschlegelia plantiphila]
MIAASYVAWGLLMTRSKTVRLEDSGFSLSYMMAWGWGMDERLSLTRRWFDFSGPSSEWLSLWKKPYNSGVAIYRSKENGEYYFGAIYRLFTLDTKSGELRSSCDSEGAPRRSELGERLAKAERVDADRIDPASEHLFRYVERDQSHGEIPASPPDSKYYVDLRYLGRFGLVRSGGRGNEIRFVPPEQASEPRLALETSCG